MNVKFIFYLDSRGNEHVIRIDRIDSIQPLREFGENDKKESGYKSAIELVDARYSIFSTDSVRTLYKRIKEVQ